MEEEINKTPALKILQLLVSYNPSMKHLAISDSKTDFKRGQINVSFLFNEALNTFF